MANSNDDRGLQRLIGNLLNQSKPSDSGLILSGQGSDKVEKRLDEVNETLKKIHESLSSGIRIRKGKEGKESDDSEDRSMTLKEELSALSSGVKKLFGGAKKIGSGVKEAVEGAYYTKPTAPVVGASSAETLKSQEAAKQALGQTRQVEVDQLKVAEETSDTQKDILKELQKLNGSAAEGGGSLVGDVNVGGGPDGKGKGGKVGKALGALGKAARFAGPVAAVAGAAYGAYEGAGKAGETFGVDQDKATFGQKAASAVGGILDPFGMGYGQSAAKGIYGALGGGQDSAAAAPTTTPSAAPSESKPKVGAAIAATAGAGAAKKESGGVSSIKGEENLEKLQMAEGELQGIFSDYKREKAKMSEKLMSDPKYPEGIVDDPKDPEYPKELKAIDDKYKKLIDAKKKEISELSKAPGIKDAKARQAKEDADFDDDKEFAPAKTKSKVTGEKTKTTTTETVSGGGSETSKRVLSADAKKAQAESAGLEDRQAAEKKQVLDKLRAEGKITGRPKASDYENIPELKELKAKQDAEAAVLSKRVDQGTSYEVSKTSGENAAMRDEITTTSGTAKPIVSNNVQTNNNTTYTPTKADPRPLHRGSALDRYNDRVSSY